MKNLISQIQILPDTPLPAGLKARILVRIRAATERTARMYRRVFATLAALSAIAFIPTGMYAMQEFSQSAFFSYLSLLFTDSGAALSNWRVFSLSLLESIPVASLVVGLSVILVFLISVRAFTRYAGRSLSYTTA